MALVANVEYGASKDLEKNRVKARNTPLGIILRSIFTLGRLRPRVRVTRRLRRRMHARNGIPLLLLPSMPHSEHRRIGLPWARYRYRQDFHTFSRQPWVLLRLVRVSNYRIRMRNQRFQVIRSGITTKSYIVLRLISYVHLQPTINCFALVRPLPFVTCRLCGSRLPSAGLPREFNQKPTTERNRFDRLLG